MSIRLRTPADLPACINCLHVVYVSDGYPSNWPADPAGWLTPSGLAAAWVATQADVTSPAQASSEPVVAGHVGAVLGVDDEILVAATSRPASELLSVSRLFVAPAARGLGLAQQLLAAVTGYAHERGLQPVLDVVDDGTAAIALYERLGWQLAGRRDAGWIDAAGNRPIARLYVGPPS